MTATFLFRRSAAIVAAYTLMLSLLGAVGAADAAPLSNRTPLAVRQAHKPATGSSKTGAATIHLSTAKGPAGTRIIITGTGFGPRENVPIKIYCWPHLCASGTFSLGTARTNKLGAFTLHTRIWPFAPAGMHGIGGTGAISKRFAGARFIVTRLQTLTLARTQGPVGTLVMVRGAGFAPHERVPLGFYCWPNNCTAGVVHLGVATASAKGTFVIKVRVPARAPLGPHGIGGIGAKSGRGAMAVFRVTPPVLKHHG